MYYFSLCVAMPATQLKSNKRDHCELFLFSFQLICLPSLQLMIGIKIREYHTCGITHFFPSEIGHTDITIFCPITSTLFIFQAALRFYHIFPPSQPTSARMRSTLGVARSPFHLKSIFFYSSPKHLKVVTKQK